MTGPLPVPDQVLPHRAPFLFLTEVTELEVGVSASGHWLLTGDEDFFGGHFPGRPTLPGVLQCESIAQLGAYALLSDPAFSGRLALFGGIDKVRFRRQVLPGDRLDLHVDLGRMSARAGKGSGRASVEGETACECELLFVFADST
ncbi:MAG: 3-hydroxyacyl-ACP dehydratase FabZ [Acidimicrobiales bacterium]|nr:3-hydroxyacyl-ACP dehydratase FabZ [Acidimicrobiales bacterium]